MEMMTVERIIGQEAEKRRRNDQEHQEELLAEVSKGLEAFERRKRWAGRALLTAAVLASASLMGAMWFPRQEPQVVCNRAGEERAVLACADWAKSPMRTHPTGGGI